MSRDIEPFLKLTQDQIDCLSIEQTIAHIRTVVGQKRGIIVGLHTRTLIHVELPKLDNLQDALFVRLQVLGGDVEALQAELKLEEDAFIRERYG